MRPPDLATAATAATRALAPTAATRASVAANPAAAATAPSAAQAGFGGLLDQVQGDVAAFIQQGSGAASAGNGAGAGLSLEGQAYLARSQSAAGLAANAATAAAAGPGGAAMAQLQDEFLSAIQPWAQQAGQRLGVAPELVAAHAALESGWGQRPVKTSDGGNSYNLFGLKAGGAWHGAEAAALTTEYAGGAALKQTQRFRSYPDQASAFQDYAQMLIDNPRYRAALNTGNDAQAFARGLAQGGYATDPHYAEKLTRVAARLNLKSGAAAPVTGED